MAPEQARGQAAQQAAATCGPARLRPLPGADRQAAVRRRDVFRRAGGVLRQTPDWEALPTGVPPRIVALVRRCLQKELKQRLRDAGDALLEIEQALDELTKGPLPLTPPRGRPSRRTLLAVAAGVGPAAFALGMWSRNLRTGGQAFPNRPPSPRRSHRPHRNSGRVSSCSATRPRGSGRASRRTVSGSRSSSCKANIPRSPSCHSTAASRTS